MPHHNFICVMELALVKQRLKIARCRYVQLGVVLGRIRKYEWCEQQANKKQVTAWTRKTRVFRISFTYTKLKKFVNIMNWTEIMINLFTNIIAYIQLLSITFPCILTYLNPTQQWGSKNFHILFEHSVLAVLRSTILSSSFFLSPFNVLCKGSVILSKQQNLDLILTRHMRVFEEGTEKAL